MLARRLILGASRAQLYVPRAAIKARWLTNATEASANLNGEASLPPSNASSSNARPQKGTETSSSPGNGSSDQKSNLDTIKKVETLEKQVSELKVLSLCWQHPLNVMLGPVSTIIS